MDITPEHGVVTTEDSTLPVTPLKDYQVERIARRKGESVVPPVAAVPATEVPEPESTVPTEHRFEDPDTGEVLDGRTRYAKRVMKLAREKNDWKAKFEQLAARPAAAPASMTPPAAQTIPAADVEPSPESFPNGQWDPGYLTARTAWIARQEVQKATTAQQQRAAEEHAKADLQTATQAYATRAQTFAKTTPDFDQVLSAVQGDVVSPVMQHAILTSDQGPQIAYWLATHVDQARGWFTHTQSFGREAMPFIRGQLEALVKPSAPAPAQPRISDAPAPAPVVSGAAVPPALPVDGSTNLASYRPQREARRKSLGLRVHG